jgi:CDP-diacylglycerol--serine O-phosphatidyltransferase
VCRQGRRPLRTPSVRSRQPGRDERGDEGRRTYHGISPADVITLARAGCGLFALLVMALPGLGTDPVRHLRGSEMPGLSAAVLLLLGAALGDLLDGAASRRFGSSPMGARLDDLADVIGFGVTPAFMVAMWAAGPGRAGMPLASAAGAAVLLAVLLRLAREPIRRPVLRGLPSPMGAVAIASIVVLGPPVPLALGLVAVVVWLMMGNTVCPRPSGRAVILMVCWAVVGAGSLVAEWTGAVDDEWPARLIAAVQLIVTAGLFPTLRLFRVRFGDNGTEPQR